MKKHYQIKLTNKQGHGSFLYFDATDDSAQEEACITANEYLKKERYKDETLSSLPFHNMFHTVYKPFKTIHVVEYDTVNHCTKRGGNKFKLYLSYIKYKLVDGSELINEWYTFD